MSRRKTLESFLKVPVIYRAPVQWGEMDSFQHVNNTVYFKYFEGARLAYMNKLLETLLKIDAENAPAFIKGWVNATGVGPILADTECSFKFPMTYPDRVLVGASVDPTTFDTTVGTRLTIRHDVWSLRHDRIVASGTGRVVIYDYAETKVVGASKAFVEAVEEMQSSSCISMLESLQTERSDAMSENGDDFVGSL